MTKVCDEKKKIKFSSTHRSFDILYLKLSIIYTQIIECVGQQS